MKNLEEFKNCVDLYSADLSLWPLDQVKPALAFMQENAEAKRYFDDMVFAEAQLRAYADQVVPSSGLEARIMAQIENMPPEKSILFPESAKKAFRWQPQRFLAPGGGLLAVLLVATFIGISPPEGMDYAMKDAPTHSSAADAEYLPFIWEEAE
jgi:hypothetical protein